jgi:Holliday junction resolvasome RuvABC endonuclease subunit
VVVGVDVPGRREGAWAVLVSDTWAVLDFGPIVFGSKSEKRDYAELGRLLDGLARRYDVKVLVIEHPFLHIIAQQVGALKMWTARRRGIAWYMITASSATKAVLGSGKLGKGAKEAVFRYVYNSLISSARRSALTQHQADAILYARAFLARRANEEMRP